MSVETPTAARSGDEAQQVREWVYPLLAGDAALAAALGVTQAALADHLWPEQAPSDREARWIVYDAQQAALVVQPVGPWDRLMVPVPLNIRCVARADDTAWAYVAMRRIHALLQGNKNAPVAHGGLILTCQRESVLDYPEDAGGIRYRHVGGIYTVQVN